MFVVHATKKLLDRCGGVSPLDTPSTARLGDWYATALFWRPQVALFVNEPTRLPVFVRLAPGRTLVPRFADHLARVLAALGVDPRFIDAEVREMHDHRLAKTVNRSVIGTMNEFALLASYHRDREDIGDLPALSSRLARTPCGPLRSSHGFPDRELAALVAQIPGLG